MNAIINTTINTTINTRANMINDALRISSLYVLLFISHSAFAAAHYSDDVRQKARQYIEKTIGHDYKAPLHCSADAPCELVRDFNGDGHLDYAGLYLYVGNTTRYKQRYVDLIIVYADKHTQQQHALFTHVGKVGFADKKELVQVVLQEQAAGFLKLPVLGIHLDFPGINIVRRNKLTAHFTTFAWNKKQQRFYSVVKEDD